jgi:hypothetical protein
MSFGRVLLLLLPIKTIIDSFIQSVIIYTFMVGRFINSDNGRSISPEHNVFHMPTLH